MSRIEQPSNKPVSPTVNRHGPGARYQAPMEQIIRANTPPIFRGLLAMR
jgi:hypothetical protein